jgi:hypothetical protein
MTGPEGGAVAAAEVLGAGEDLLKLMGLPAASLITTALDAFFGFTKLLDCAACDCWPETGVCEGGGACGKEGVPG